MPDMPPFPVLLQRLAQGDEAAAAVLVRDYGSVVRTVVRRWLDGNPGLRPAIDLSDVCQSVLKSFFLGFRRGGFAVGNPAALRALLARIAQHKILDHIRHETAEKCDRRRLEGGLDTLQGVPAPVNPFADLERADLLDAARAALAPDEQEIWDLRKAGHSWQESAALLRETPDALRMKLHRALARLRARFCGMGADHA